MNRGLGGVTMCQTCRKHHPELFTDKPIVKPVAKPEKVSRKNK
jgi:hypothetical protein